MKRSIILICLVTCVLQAQAQSTIPKITDSLDTIAGKLSILSLTDAADLRLDLVQLNGRTLAKVEDAGILAYYKGSSDEFVVLGVSLANSCGYEKFRVIRLQDPKYPGDVATISDEFGDCTEIPRIAFRDDEVTEIRIDDWAYRYSYGRYKKAKIIHIVPSSRRRGR